MKLFAQETRLSRRSVLKGGAALGAGMAAGLAAPALVSAQGSLVKVSILNSSGSLSQVQTLMFKELKLFEKYGVEPNLLNVSDGNKILAGLISGDGDICGGSGFNGLFPAIEKGAKIKILAGSNLAPITILVANKPDIKSVKDLPGRNVGTGALGANLHQLVVASMKKYGVDYKKVRFVNVGSSTDIFKALVGGSIDAGVISIEFRDSVEKYKLHNIEGGLFYKEVPQYTNQAMYAPDRAIAAKREGLKGVMAAYADLFRWIGKPENKAGFLDFYRKALNTKTSGEEGVFFADFLAQPGVLAVNLVLTPEQISFVQDLNVELGAQKAVLPFDQCTDMTLAQEAVKLVKA
jgi:ABC-type nitrate/sulfonate/bicarbonate transport system substrate-binding protein